MVPIIKKQRDFNSDLGSYIDRRKGNKTSFLDKVSFLSKSERSQKVPSVSSTSPTVYGEEKPSFFSRMFKRKPRRTADVLEEELDQVELPPEQKEELTEVAEEIQDIEDAEDQLEERRQGLLGRFFSGLFGGRRRAPEEDLEDISTDAIEEVVQTQEDLMREETKQVLRSLHKWISRLPPEQIEAFRRSPDFDAYKDLLQKYGLAK